jgi:hypothetical protein
MRLTVNTSLHKKTSTPHRPLSHQDLVVTCFLDKYTMHFYWHNQTMWHVCLFEGWSHLELHGQPQAQISKQKVPNQAPEHYAPKENIPRPRIRA